MLRRRDEFGGREIGNEALEPGGRCSVRCTRAKPRFQFGSHCAVTVAIAARITPIRAVASSASTSVKPAMRAARLHGLIRSASGAGARC